MKVLITQFPKADATKPDFLEVHLEPRVLTTGVKDPDGKEPDAVRRRKILRIPFNPCLDHLAIVSLMGALEPYAQRILEGSELIWTGNVFHGTGGFSGDFNKDASMAYTEALIIAETWEDSKNTKET